MLSISHWTLLSLEQSAQTIIFAPSIMALIGGPMIRRPQTSHRIGLFHLNSFINLLLFIVFVLLITIPCEIRAHRLFLIDSESLRARRRVRLREKSYEF